jgi:hypothetical protein
MGQKGYVAGCEYAGGGNPWDRKATWLEGDNPWDRKTMWLEASTLEGDNPWNFFPDAEYEGLSA